jgi:hypothetical protein
MLISIASFLPIIIVGPIADAVGPGPVLTGVAVAVLLSAVGSIVWANPVRGDVRGPSGLIEPLDPISVSGRSLTTPVSLEYVDEPTGEVFDVASPVVPGQAGPANGEDVTAHRPGP